MFGDSHIVAFRENVVRCQGKSKVISMEMPPKNRVVGIRRRENEEGPCRWRSRNLLKFAIFQRVYWGFAFLQS
jgi:hypothetical protein